MNKDFFLQLFEPSVSISPSAMPELEEITKKYPYCQLVHVLNAKAHQQQQSAQVSERVKTAAVYAVNRNALKKLLFPKIEKTPAALTPVRQNIIAPLSTPQADIPAEKVAPVVPIEELPTRSYFEQSQLEDNILTANVQELPTPAGSLPEVTQPDVEETEAANTRKADKHQQSEIIETFIKNEPRITSLHKADKNKPQSTQDLSERSITLPSGLISENLAGIMIKQGKTDKAIEIYEKLILKNPQKKAYFAEKIEQLKNQ